ncbi:hypothetical protein [Tissierella creatinophila]|uniref:Uncharacterized protein n=1 Tax=Tissierella creatinophila DSM 6911 TaxID=1123403 RepID=A0A1U7M695_TISCR|nr:hypothetical protein [Tissierella creatinophila]OLS02806.1 hypothetical protein TICRE_12230 [Tissierella creatinophila DSM 6911]
MVNFILGAKGTGKTKWLIDNANKDKKEGNGNIAFVDVDDDHIFTLDYNVRLINAMEFKILDIESFYGFLCGIISRDYDIEKIYVDGIYKIMDIEIKDLKKLLEKLTFIGEKFNTEFFINVDYVLEDIPENLKSYCIELEPIAYDKELRVNA